MLGYITALKDIKSGGVTITKPNSHSKVKSFIRPIVWIFSDMIPDPEFIRGNLWKMWTISKTNELVTYTPPPRFPEYEVKKAMTKEEEIKFLLEKLKDEYVIKLDYNTSDQSDYNWYNWQEAEIQLDKWVQEIDSKIENELDLNYFKSNDYDKYESLYRLHLQKMLKEEREGKSEIII